MSAGYSGKPVYEKLGIKPGYRVCVLNQPMDYEKLVEGTVPGVRITYNTRFTAEIAHVFVTEAKELRRQLPSLKRVIAPNGAIWVSWPKKSAKVPTDITEDTVREAAFPLDLVDIKVCAINEVWSGLKLVIRKEKRP